MEHQPTRLRWLAKEGNWFFSMFRWTVSWMLKFLLIQNYNFNKIIKEVTKESSRALLQCIPSAMIIFNKINRSSHQLSSSPPPCTKCDPPVEETSWEGWLSGLCFPFIKLFSFNSGSPFTLPGSLNFWPPIIFFGSPCLSKEIYWTDSFFYGRLFSLEVLVFFSLDSGRPVPGLVAFFSTGGGAK